VTHAKALVNLAERAEATRPCSALAAGPAAKVARQEDLMRLAHRLNSARRPAQTGVPPMHVHVIGGRP